MGAGRQATFRQSVEQPAQLVFPQLSGQVRVAARNGCGPAPIGAGAISGVLASPWAAIDTGPFASSPGHGGSRWMSVWKIMCGLLFVGGLGGLPEHEGDVSKSRARASTAPREEEWLGSSPSRCEPGASEGVLRPAVTQLRPIWTQRSGASTAVRLSETRRQWLPERSRSTDGRGVVTWLRACEATAQP